MRCQRAALPLMLLALTGCATLPGGPRWGQNVTIKPGWARAPRGHLGGHGSLGLGSARRCRSAAVR